MSILLIILLLIVTCIYTTILHAGGATSDYPQDKVKYKYLEFSKDERRWVTESEYNELLKSSTCMGPNFIDLTDLYYKSMNFLDNVIERSLERRAPRELTKQNVFNTLVSRLDIHRVYNIIETLSSLHTRYYTSIPGGIASDMIYHYLNSIKGDNCTVEYFNHKPEASPVQKSVIAKILGQSDESVIYCAHIDSINSKVGEDERETARSPGADDNATGVANVLEVFRVLSGTRIRPEKTMEFHFYAGEEKGLRGSTEVAESYKLQGKQVAGVLNNDMTGYSEDGVTAYIVNGEDDFVDPELVDFCFKLAGAYTYLQLQSGRCGYACSDHFSWARNGYSAACVSEATPKLGKLNPNNHSAHDDMSMINIPYTFEHAKLGLGFMVEMGY